MFAARRQFSTGGLLSRNGQHRRDDDQRGAGAGESAACAGWRPATHANAECADHERRSAGGMTMLKKDFGLSVKDVSDEGTFEGYASTFGGSPDSYGDVVLPGAFAESLVRHKREGTLPLLLWGHTASALPIGHWVDLAEDGKGLWGKAQIDLEERGGRSVARTRRGKGKSGDERGSTKG